MTNPAFEKYIETLEVTYKMLNKMVNISHDEDSYEGGRNTNGAPHGFGKMIYADGNIYEGNWLNGKRSEKGRLTLTTGTIYEGEWADNKRNGQGEITYGESSSFGHGNVYNGGWKDDEKHGEGIFYNDSNQSKLTQIWENGILVDAYGDGCLDIEEFSIEYGCYDEESTKTEYIIGYYGEIKNNLPNGKGSIMFAGINGDWESEYDGSWKNGLFDGYGVLTYSGYNYQGEWKEGKKHGKGKLKMPSGCIFDGDWIEGLLHGQGTYTSNYDSYEGGWKRGVYHGHGIKKEDTNIEEGEFRDGKFWNGYLKDFYFDGSISNGKRAHGRVYSTFKEFEWIEGDFSNDNIIGNAIGKLKNGKIVDVNGDGNGRITYKN